jgi:hypothetical protein
MLKPEGTMTLEDLDIEPPTNWPTPEAMSRMSISDLMDLENALSADEDAIAFELKDLKLKRKQVCEAAAAMLQDDINEAFSEKIDAGGIDHGVVHVEHDGVKVKVDIDCKRSFDQPALRALCMEYPEQMMELVDAKLHVPEKKLNGLERDGVIYASLIKASRLTYSEPKIEFKGDAR